MIIGSHVNFGKKQLLGSVEQALSYGANTFMFYTGAPQNTFRSKLDPELTKQALSLMQENNISLDHIICHAPYIINLANKDNLSSWQFSINFLKNEIKRVQEIGCKYIVVHPGNYLKMSLDIALNNIIEALNEVLDSDDNVMVLIETMAGKGTECGRCLEEIKTIVKGIKKQELIGVCLDTCHLNDSGIDLNNFDQYLDDFDQNIGIEKIKCLHLNDSKNSIGSHKDRHANLGYGTIGFNTLLNIYLNPKLKDVPKILETPYVGEYAPYKIEIDMLKNKTFNPNLNSYFNTDENFGKYS